MDNCLFSTLPAKKGKPNCGELIRVYSVTRYFLPNPGLGTSLLSPHAASKLPRMCRPMCPI
jgi:hypothetical protein